MKTLFKGLLSGVMFKVIFVSLIIYLNSSSNKGPSQVHDDVEIPKLIDAPLIIGLGQTNGVYLGVFMYSMTVPSEVQEIKNVCSDAFSSYCYEFKSYLLYTDLSRIKAHLQNMCEYSIYPQNIGNDSIKIIASCPIIDSKKVLRGYILYATDKEVSESETVNKLRLIANDISSKF